MTRTRNRTQPNLNRTRDEHALKRERSVKEPRNTLSATLRANTQQARNRTQPNTGRTQAQSNLSNAIKRAALCRLCRAYKKGTSGHRTGIQAAPCVIYVKPEKGAKRQRTGKAPQSSSLEVMPQLSKVIKRTSHTIRTENEQRKTRLAITKGKPRGDALRTPSEPRGEPLLNQS